MSFFSNFSRKSIIGTLRRHAHDDGWLKKNLRIEEHSGLRELGYRDYVFNLTEFAWHSIFLFIPGFVLYRTFKSDLERMDQKVGIKNRKYGILPPVHNH